MKSIRLITFVFVSVACFSPIRANEQESVPEENSPKYNACIFCHKDLPGKLSGVIEEWKQSMHFKNGVTCDNCHGGDASVNSQQFENSEEFKKRSHLQRDREFFVIDKPDSNFTSSVRGRNVSYFCGKCHAQIKEKHLGSPHGDLGDPTCLYCHGQGSHAIRESNVDIIDTRTRTEGGRCALCHRAATMEAVANIKKTLVDAQQKLNSVTEQYALLEEKGYKNLEMERIYHHSKETLSMLRQTFHSFNMREINNFASAIKENAELTQSTYDMIVSLEQAKVKQAEIGAASVVFLLSFAALLLYYRKKFLHLSST